MAAEITLREALKTLHVDEETSDITSNEFELWDFGPSKSSNARGPKRRRSSHALRRLC
jgi:hypothetical protein